MIETRSTRSIERLVAIKREALDEFRQDAARLDVVVRTVDERYRQASERSKQFLAETASNEIRGKALDANVMIVARQYLQRLQALSTEIWQELDQAKVRHEEAQSQLETAFTEVRALERLLERRQKITQIQESRKSYLAADDQEICRSAQPRDTYADC